MGISRLHIALLAVMSLFTGIIAPGTMTDTTALVYPMTDARSFSYALLFFLIIGFYTAAIHAWRLFRYNWVLIFGMVGILFFLTITGGITEVKTGDLTHGLGWGWIFFVIGTLLLIRTYMGRERDENISEIRQTIDTLLGVVGSFTLACIAGVIILISLTFREKSYQSSILETMIGTGWLTTMSGLILSEPYTEILYLEYDRKSWDLIISARSGSIWNTLYHTSDTMYFQSGTFRTPLALQGKLYTYDRDGQVFSGMTLMNNMEKVIGKDVLITQSGSDWNIVSEKSKWSLDYTGSISSPIISGDYGTLAWIEKRGEKYSIIKSGKPVWWEYEKVYQIDLSNGGYDLMALVSSGSSMQIVKNGMPLWQIQPGYISGSYQSNGSHSLYKVQRENAYVLIYDGEALPQSYDDIREIFIEKNGGYYAYFARPIGGIEYCLFTKYRGNICGLDGYMNPSFSADGSSILYAGYKDDVWSIYRNTDILVRNTGYSNTDISGDYVFFDVTNPRTYLFVKKDVPTGKYILIKNGKTLPWLWDDFGTDVSFGYDNHILLKLRDSSGWRIAEI
jgi:hypothetical protein